MVRSGGCSLMRKSQTSHWSRNAKSQEKSEKGDTGKARYHVYIRNFALRHLQGFMQILALDEKENDQLYTQIF